MAVWHRGKGVPPGMTSIDVQTAAIDVNTAPADQLCRLLGRDPRAVKASVRAQLAHEQKVRDQAAQAERERQRQADRDRQRDLGEQRDADRDKQREADQGRQRQAERDRSGRE